MYNNRGLPNTRSKELIESGLNELSPPLNLNNKHEDDGDISQPNQKTIEGQRTVFNKIEHLKRFPPNTFRHWPDPPSPPPRSRILEKKYGILRKRPGSADPRFHKHIITIPKPNLVTQSEQKVAVKTAVLNKDATSAPQLLRDSPQALSYDDIKHTILDVVPRSPKASAVTPKSTLRSSTPRYHSVQSEIPDIDCQSCISGSYYSPASTSQHASETRPVVLESLLSAPNVTPRYSSPKDTHNFLINDSTTTVATEEEDLTPSIIRTRSLTSLGRVNDKSSLAHQVCFAEDYYMHGSETDSAETLMDIHDSQLNVLCSNPTHGGFLTKPHTNYTFSLLTILVWCFGIITGTGIIAGLLFIWPKMLNHMECFQYWRQPQPEFPEITAFASVLETTLKFTIRILRPFLSILTMPVIR